MKKNNDYEKSSNQWRNICESLLMQADICINGDREFDIQVSNPDFYKRVLQQGSLGLGESYMDGWWDCERLDEFFYRILLAELDVKLPKNFSDIMRVAIARVLNRQNKKRAWIVGEEHYNLGNDLFSLMLDPCMQYSCGYWHEATSLEQAQRNKLDLICRKLQLKSGMNVLDIGCGWGGFSLYAAKYYGVSVTGVTISEEQQKFAQEYCQGYDVNILLKDYRDLNGQFDRIVSIGMFEHVGPKNYDVFFEVARRNLKDEGLFLLHTIGSNIDSINSDPWIDKYIFPNGVLPSISHIAHSSVNKFVMEDWHNFGNDYDQTLMAWYENFINNWSTLQDNYTPKFKRMFTYYLNSCAGAFRARNIQLWQILWSKKGILGGVRVAR